MDSEKSQDSGQKAVQETPVEIIRLLDRLVERGWARRWWQDDNVKTRIIVWTPGGWARMTQLLETVDALDYRGMKSWFALEAIISGVAGENRVE